MADSYRPPLPIRYQPLTPKHCEALPYFARGLSYPEIGALMRPGIGAGRVRQLAREIAMRIPNPHGLPPYRLVMAFAIAQQYTASVSRDTEAKAS